MSDTITTTPDPATDALRDRVRQIEADIQLHARRLEVATACRDELAEVIAMIGRKAARTAPRRSRPAPVVPAPEVIATEARPSMFVVPPMVDREPIAEAG